MHGRGVEAYSAGSKPSGKVNEKAIESMREIGYNLSAHASKALDEIPPGPYDVVVTMGCGDACPWVAAKRREDWDIPDPKGMNADEFRKVRFDIAMRVDELINSLSARRV
jgi:protein-tyrosine-phosphatase